MAKNNNLGDFLKSLADKFRNYLYSDDLINPQDFEDKITEVNSAGYERGYSDGGYNGYQQAKHEAYDTFWDTFQKNGNRRNYNYAFFDGWTNANFAPKYDIIAELGHSTFMFSQSNITGSLKTILNNQGVTISFIQPSGKAYGANSLFYLSSFSELPVIDFSMALGNAALQSTFGNCQNLETIEKIILPNNCTGYGTDTFKYCRKLETVNFQGRIKYSLSFADCPLTGICAQGIVYDLDLESSDEERTITFKSDIPQKICDYANEDSAYWDFLVSDRGEYNWTFALV